MGSITRAISDRVDEFGSVEAYLESLGTEVFSIRQTHYFIYREMIVVDPTRVAALFSRKSGNEVLLLRVTNRMHSADLNHDQVVDHFENKVAEWEKLDEEFKMEENQ